jgi:hypothetical protein
VGNEYAAGIRAAANEYQSSPVAALPREWAAIQHAGVCQGVWLQEGRSDGTRASLQDLVAKSSKSYKQEPECQEFVGGVIR